MSTKHYSAALIPCAAMVSLLHGCTNMPSHDGSFEARYGLETDVEKTAEPEKQIAVEPAENEYKPLVMTLADPSSVQTRPFDERGAEVIQTVPKPIITPRVTEYSPEAHPVIQVPETARNASTESIIDKYPARKSHPHVLGAGETLYSIATRFTGTSANWKQIADFNGIDSPDAMTVGQEILIPLHLVVTETSEQSEQAAYTLVSPSRSSMDETADNLTEDLPDRQPDTAGDTIWEITTAPAAAPLIGEKEMSVPAPDAVIDSTEAVAVDYSMNESGTAGQPIATAHAEAEVTEDTVKEPTGFRARVSRLAEKIKARIRPETAAGAVTAGTTAAAAVPTSMKVPPAHSEKDDRADQGDTVAGEAIRWIQIEGDFTPKAIYSGAGYDSDLLMRVSPGTTLKLTHESNDWYQVETSKGAGYVYHRDAMILDNGL